MNFVNFSVSCFFSSCCGLVGLLFILWWLIVDGCVAGWVGIG